MINYLQDNRLVSWMMVPKKDSKGDESNEKDPITKKSSVSRDFIKYFIFYIFLEPL